MAAAVQTVTVTGRGVIGDHKYVDATISYDTGDYATGGIALVASNLGMLRLDNMIVTGGTVVNGVYDKTAGKMKLYVSATGAEEAADALTASSIVYVRAFGI